jgi:DNA-binding transcriptional ArsR family regulator
MTPAQVSALGVKRAALVDLGRHLGMFVTKHHHDGNLALVWHEERTASEIASEFSMSGPAISQHLKVLLDSGLVLLRRSGTRRFYRVNQSAIASLQAELAAFWDDGLSRLKRAAEQKERRSRR